jgi:hypothetical protein
MSDRQLVFEDFADKVGQIFTVTFDDAPCVAMALVAAEPLKAQQPPPAGRPPFSLIFVADTAQMLPQRLYRVEQEALGQVTLFLVPVGKKPEGFEYQALFN